MYQSESAPWLWFRAWNTDGSAKTDLVFNTSGIDVKVARDNLANSSSLSLSAASSPTDWAAGKLSPIVGNLYRVGISTALISSYTGNIAVCGSYTGGVLEGIIDSVSAYDPTKNPLSPSVAGRQIAISATTGRVTAEAVELDADSRVKLDASQPDYAPLLASGYTAPANADITAIKAKTDNLPSDPADQSLIIAATDAVMGRLGAPAGASMSADIASVKTDTGTMIPGLFNTLTAKVRKYIQLLFRKDAAIATDNAAELTELNANGGSGAGSASNATDSLEAIRDRGDSAWITGSGGGSGGTTTIVTLQAVAGISPGVIVGPSEPLVIGDDYLTAMNRSIRINLLDADGDPAEVEFGAYALDDAGISIQLLLARSGKPSTVADLVGTCTFFPAVGDVPPYLIVEFTRTETTKAIPGAYDMQAEAVWNDGKVVTFAPYGQIEFVRNIRRS